MMCLWARGQGWNPDSPAEPSSRYRLSVKAVPAEAATTSGSGHYTVNSRVTVSATATAECWQFRGWTDSKDQPVSDWSKFTPIRDKIAISCMLREIHEFSSHAIRHGLYIKNRKRLFCP